MPHGSQHPSGWFSDLESPLERCVSGAPGLDDALGDLDLRQHSIPVSTVTQLVDGYTNNNSANKQSFIS